MKKTKSRKFNLRRTATSRNKVKRQKTKKRIKKKSSNFINDDNSVGNSDDDFVFDADEDDDNNEMIDIKSNAIISIPSDTDESEVTTSPKVKRKKTKRLQRRRTPKSLKRKKTNKSVNDLTSEIDLEHDLHDINETIVHAEEGNDDDNDHVTVDNSDADIDQMIDIDDIV